MTLPNASRRSRVQREATGADGNEDDGVPTPRASPPTDSAALGAAMKPELATLAIVASVSIKTGFIFSSVLGESSGNR